MTSDTANRHVERVDTFVRVTHIVGGRLADPRQARDRHLTKNLPQRRRDNVRPEASDFFARGEYKHQRALESSCVKSAHRVETLRDKPLHVGGPAPIDSIARGFELERFPRPSRLAVIRHRIDMPRNDQPVGARRSNPRDQVGLRNSKKLNWLKQCLKAMTRELLRQIFDRRQIALCANGVKTHQPPRNVVQIVIHIKDSGIISRL